MAELTFSNLRDNVAVDLNPESMDRYPQELGYLGYDPREEHNEDLYGQYLVVTLGGIEILSAREFHRTWKFYDAHNADRLHFRTIIPR
jgi:hypothetical protein